MDYNIGDMIAKLADKKEEVYSIICKVSKVSGEVAELAPLNGDASLFDVKLLAGTSGTPFLITPVVGSTVIATFLSKDTAFISLYSEIESVQVMGDQFGGLVKIEELIKNLDKLTARVDGIIDAIKNGVPIPTDGGAGLQTTIKTALALLVDKEDFTTIENENIKHG
tara:strand:+ start:3286 stop:3786 length:501 start_codon:yes stop_codon:yes gene_type:complete